MTADRPAAALFAGIVGQDEAVAALRAAAANPVHAYLLRGPAGNGGLAAAHGFAAALLCPEGGCGECATCRASLAGTDPDLHVVRRSGASVSIAEIRQIVSLAQRRPLHVSRQVIIVLDVHLAALRAPALLKTLEEPRGHRVRAAGRRGLARAGHGGESVRRDPVPAGAARRDGAMADGVGRSGRHGHGGGRQQWRQPGAGQGHGGGS